MTSRTEPRCPRADDGFTLVELLLAIVIMGVITVPLTDVVLGFMRNTDATTARLLESHDVQIASAYWAQDVASIGTRSKTSPYPLTQSVEMNVSYDSGNNPCGFDATPTTPSTPNAIVRLAWDDFSRPAEATVVVYVKQDTELHRLRCNGSATVVSDVILAHHLDPSKPPAVACSDTAGEESDCTAVPAVPHTATLTLTVKDPGNPGAAYGVPLTGHPRQSP